MSVPALIGVWPAIASSWSSIVTGSMEELPLTDVIAIAMKRRYCLSRLASRWLFGQSGTVFVARKLAEQS